MKIVHFENGLGNQMACYAIYEATKYSNPTDNVYIDTYIYNIKEAGDVVSMWNGYELDKIFGLNLPNIKTLFSEQEIKEQIEYLRKSEFWKHGWNYEDVFIEMMSNYGIELKSAYGNVGEDEGEKCGRSVIRKFFRKYGANSANSKLGYEIKKIVHFLNRKISKDCGMYLLKKRDGNYFYNITLDFMKSPKLNDCLGEKIQSNLEFKEPTDVENVEYLKKIRGSSSVSIHVRRSDYLQYNEDCYRYGYFIKCVNYIKKRVKKPVFFIFSDDLEWCENNVEQLGLNHHDEIYFVDINKQNDSYKDMQLMSNCKYNIATKSSFGWWAGFLNKYSQKITCCQMGEYICTKQF